MEVPVMLSFGNAGGLRNFQLHEVQSTALLDDVLDQCGPENWRSNMDTYMDATSRVPRKLLTPYFDLL